MKTISGLVWVAMICLGCGGSTLKQGPSGGRASGGQGGGGFNTSAGLGGNPAESGGIASGGHAGSSLASAGGTGGTHGTACGVCTTILCRFETRSPTMANTW